MNFKLFKPFYLNNGIFVQLNSYIFSFHLYRAHVKNAFYKIY